MHVNFYCIQLITVIEMVKSLSVFWESGVWLGFISVNAFVFWYMLVSAAPLNAAICPPKITFIRLFAEGKKQQRQNRNALSSPSEHGSQMEWMGAIRMRVHTADKNITIIHSGEKYLSNCKVSALCECEYMSSIYSISCSTGLVWIIVMLLIILKAPTHCRGEQAIYC